jgi:hypothetical protein
VPGEPISSTPLGDLAAQALEFLGILEELDDLLEFLLGFVDPGHVLEGGLLLVGGEQLGLGLAEAHGLGATGLHLPEEHEPQPNQDQERRPHQQAGQQPTVGRLLDLDDDVGLPQLRDEVVIPGVVGEVVVAGSAHRTLLGFGGPDVDFLALDEDAIHLAGGHLVQEV